MRNIIIQYLFSICELFEIDDYLDYDDDNFLCYMIRALEDFGIIKSFFYRDTFHDTDYYIVIRDKNRYCYIELKTR